VYFDPALLVLEHVAQLAHRSFPELGGYPWNFLSRANDSRLAAGQHGTQGHEK
jgi:hypothetical protein